MKGNIFLTFVLVMVIGLAVGVGWRNMTLYQRLYQAERDLVLTAGDERLHSAELDKCRKERRAWRERAQDGRQP